jgi:hypothetical protein
MTKGWWQSKRSSVLGYERTVALRVGYMGVGRFAHRRGAPSQ